MFSFLKSRNFGTLGFAAGSALVLSLCAAAGSVSGQSLELKKAQKEIDPGIATYKSEIIEKCGDFKFEMSVDYNSFAPIPDRIGLVNSQGLMQARNALRAICTNSSRSTERDEDAAAAVRSKIKSIVITNIEDPKKKSVTLSKDGVLTVMSSFSTPAGVLDHVAIKKQLTGML